jgi:kojibiose phosphorylase
MGSPETTTTTAADWDDAGAWTVRTDGFDAAGLRHEETVFTIGNGNFCVRGSFEEGHPTSNAGSFMHRVWDDMPVHVTELAGLPRWWGLDLWLDGQRVLTDDDAASGMRRSLDLRAGLFTRAFTWQADPDGARIEVSHERFVSLVDPHAAMLRTTVTLAEGEARLRVRAGASIHVENTGLLHWRLVGQSTGEDGVALVTVTRASGIPVATVVRTDLSAPAEFTPGDADGAPSADYVLTLRGGQPVEIVRSVGIVPGIDTERPLAVAREASDRLAEQGWDRSLAASAEAWRQVWSDCDIEIDGDPEAQLSVRYNVFQLVIAAPRFTEDASIGAKTLSGYGYRHHVFWDTETFMLPVFTFTQPDVARNMLAYRCRRLAGARAKAAHNGFRGAQFPWESAGTGDEVTPTWVQHYAKPDELVRIWTGDIEIHITADIAYALLQYVKVTGDEEFLRTQGAELVLDGARFWASAAVEEADGTFHYRDVIGPDEYHEHVDDNAYTNHLAAWHLRSALEVWEHLRRTAPDVASSLAERLELDDAERARWADVASRIHLAVDETGLIEQFSGYFGLEDVDQAVIRDPARTLSMQQVHGIEGCNRTQNLKQPDVLMLCYLLPELFTPEQVAANYRYYDPRTDHELGSSLGPAISAVMACRAGDPETGYAHFLRAARADLLDVRANAADGIHGASAGGLWQAVVFGFAGLTLRDDGWDVRPALPHSWTRLRFSFRHRGVRQVVELTA